MQLRRLRLRTAALAVSLTATALVLHAQSTPIGDVEAHGDIGPLTNDEWNNWKGTF